MSAKSAIFKAQTKDLLPEGERSFGILKFVILTKI